jgi:hypothetical protein
MELRGVRTATCAGVTVSVTFVLAACSGGGSGSMTPKTQTESRFLLQAKQGLPNGSDIVYVANPPRHLAIVGVTLDGSGQTWS